MIVQTSLDIARQPQEVFDFLADQANWAALDAALVDVSPRGPIGPGLSGTMIRRVNRMHVTNSWLVTEFDPGTRLEMRIGGRGYELTETTTLHAAPGGTRATIVDELLPTSMFGRVFVALSGSFIRRDLKERSERLRSSLAEAS